ncbi:4-galactosyl-N-acetylglucosaminide 3-alpha-L-fucosyltransferase FUT6 isoform X2 [Perognathus longimembris pacificus]|uniref:4-galactosyl-N-acetylglucosaminide 3-alpha-L-fucosyltransferase FUT6 isoform X2 n=1 Tax=Perognathus longimembris pacificus TaxID=214514 RepID=UPI002019D49F|nr:4-galactosyl-N-acetylglucosaminide 3-alpha-L-fucosyltransferase FUT6 isoform X2 [Perognathus longimembris pacificus]
MELLPWAKLQCPWRWCLPGLMSLALFCFYFSISQDSPAPTTPSSSARPGSAAAPPADQPLLILLWTWPFHNPVALPRCSELLPGTADCHITADRTAYPRADGVIVHHREVSASPAALLPPSPRRPAGQRWVWFSMESPSHCARLRALDGYFNLTMSYRLDSDIFTPYGWLEPWRGPPAEAQVNVSAKSGLAAWAVSNWRPGSARVRYFRRLQPHLRVDVFGAGHRPLPRGAMMARLAQYKFYLAFENSLHPDYITEKLWKNALLAAAVPVVLGPARHNYERFLPPDAFIHVDDFASPEALAQHLHMLDADPARYLRHFRWREALRPRLGSWGLAFCKACRRLQQDHRYQTVPSIASWFT